MQHAHGDAADPRSTRCHCVEIEAPAGSDIVRPPNPGFTDFTTVGAILAGGTRSLEVFWRDLLADVSEGQNDQRIPCPLLVGLD